MTRPISIHQPLPLRNDISLSPETRLYFEDAQRIADLASRALGAIARLPRQHAGPLRLPLRRLRLCYRNGRLFGDRFRSAAHIVSEDIAAMSWAMPDTAAWDELVVVLRELVRANWQFRQQTLDEPTWCDLHEGLAVLNRHDGCIPFVATLLAEAFGTGCVDATVAPPVHG